MLSIERVYSDIDTFNLTTDDGKTVIVELRIASCYLDSPEYFINNIRLTETEMLELVSAFLGARKNWDDFKSREE